MKNKRARVLIVDDDPTNIAILGHILQVEYDIMVAVDGKTCLENVYSETPPDIILLDIMMPEMDGYEVCERLQSNQQSCDIPVIFVTSLTDAENESKGLALGAVDYISKPVNSAIVKRRVKNHLQLKQQRDRLIYQQQELLFANKRNQMILDAAAEGIYGINQDGNIIFINQAALNMIGCREDEVLGKNSCSLLHRDKNTGGIQCLESECAVLQTMIQGGILQNNDAVFWRQETPFPVAYTAAPAFENGEIVGAVVVFSDISIRKQMEIEMLQSGKLKAFEVLSGGLAHDFNNLLAGIIGYLDLSLLELQSSEKIHDYLTRCMNSCEAARLLVSKFLTIAEADIQYKEKIDLQKTCTRIVKPLLADTYIDWNINIEDNIWPLEVSPLQFIQLMTNIVQNSLEAMANGGTLTIKAQNCPDGFAEQTSLVSGKYLKLSIQDQGTGISAVDYARIFDPYFSTKPRGLQKGMGLGLSICQAIVRMHHGHIEIDSAPGRGTTVYVYLPVVVDDV